MKPSYENKIGKVFYNGMEINLQSTIPTETITIKNNGTHDVTNYGKASVSVPRYDYLLTIESAGLTPKENVLDEQLMDDINANIGENLPFVMQDTGGNTIHTLTEFRYYFDYNRQNVITSIIVYDDNKLASTAQRDIWSRFFSMFEFPIYCNDSLLNSPTNLISTLKSGGNGSEHSFTETHITKKASDTINAYYSSNPRLAKIEYMGTINNVYPVIQYNRYVEEVKINKGHNTIPASCFYNCINLRRVICLTDTPITLSNRNAFTGVNDVELWVNQGLADAYINATNWAEVIELNHWVVHELDENGEIPAE